MSAADEAIRYDPRREGIFGDVGASAPTRYGKRSQRSSRESRPGR